MSRKGVWLLEQALIGALAWSTAHAQRVDADPPDVYADIEGPVSVAGGFPLSLAELPPGDYEFEAWGLGLAKSRGHFLRTADGLAVRPWASAWSLLAPPGIAHLLHNDPHGWSHLGAGVLSATFLALNQVDASDAKDHVDAAMHGVDNAVDNLVMAYQALNNAQPDQIDSLLTNLSEAHLGLDRASIDLFEARAEKDDETRIRSLWAGYFAGVWLGAGLEAWLLTPEPSAATDANGRSVVTFPRADRWAAVLRSALVPGSGQRYLGHDVRASVLSGLVTASAAGAILAQDSFLAARRDHLVAQRELDAGLEGASQAAVDAAASDRDRSSRLRWILTGTAASLYVWNVVDAMLLGGSAQSQAPPPVSLVPTTSGLALRITFGGP
jgi:hypothetical protein